MDAQKNSGNSEFLYCTINWGQIRKVELFINYVPKNLMQHGKKKVQNSFLDQQKNKDGLQRTWENVSKVPKKLFTRMALQFLGNMRGEGVK
jgi:hypothetical protein